MKIKRTHFKRKINCSKVLRNRLWHWQPAPFDPLCPYNNTWFYSEPAISLSWLAALFGKKN